MQQDTNHAEQRKPVVEIASDETVLRALAQSAHPVEFIESSGPAEGSSDSATHAIRPQLV
jgi:hypothetical protein